MNKNSCCWLLLMGAATCGLTGCGQQATETAASAANPPDSTIEASPGAFAREELITSPLPTGLTTQTPPDQIVAAFLGALRSDDHGVAEALLTQRALVETRKRNLPVQQFGSPWATFTIDTPVYLGTHQNGAHVNTRWTEQSETGVIEYEIIWTLRRQNVGWRVAGMGAQLGPDLPIEYLNFEDPDKMLAKLHAAEEAIAAAEAADAGIRQAQLTERQLTERQLTESPIPESQIRTGQYPQGRNLQAPRTFQR